MGLEYLYKKEGKRCWKVFFTSSTSSSISTLQSNHQPFQQTPPHHITTTTTTITKMHFSLPTLLLAASSTLTSASPLAPRQTPTSCPIVQEGDYIWKLSSFWARKLDGKNINSIGFNIKATNEGTLDFTCSASADTVEDGKFYQCGENSLIWFAFQADRNGVLIRQDVSDR